jgi:hypothetical protein
MADPGVIRRLNTKSSAFIMIPKRGIAQHRKLSREKAGMPPVCLFLNADVSGKRFSQGMNGEEERARG